jgi:hypothetical protein
MDKLETTVKEELTKLVVKRFPKISYNDCVAFVQEFELELKRLREHQIAEEQQTPAE